MRIRSTSHKELMITSPRVDFVGGEAEVSDEDYALLEPFMSMWGLEDVSYGEQPETPEEKQPKQPSDPPKDVDGTEEQEGDPKGKRSRT